MSLANDSKRAYRNTRFAVFTNIDNNKEDKSPRGAIEENLEND